MGDVDLDNSCNKNPAMYDIWEGGSKGLKLPWGTRTIIKLALMRNGRQRKLGARILSQIKMGTKLPGMGLYLNGSRLKKKRTLNVGFLQDSKFTY